MNKYDYLKKAVVFSSPYGDMNIPIGDFLNEDDIDYIAKDNDSERDMELEIIDTIYFNLEFESKIV